MNPYVIGKKTVECLDKNNKKEKQINIIFVFLRFRKKIRYQEKNTILRIRKKKEMENLKIIEDKEKENYLKYYT